MKWNPRYSLDIIMKINRGKVNDIFIFVKLLRTKEKREVLHFIRVNGCQVLLKD